MQIRKLSHRVAVLWLLLAAMPTFAQPKKAIAPATPTYSQRPFDPTLLRLLPHFMGNDVVRLFKIHEALRTAKKGEFETTEQFDKRIQEGETRLFMGSDNELTLAFVVPVTSVYDADRQVLIAAVAHSTPAGTIYGEASDSIVVKYSRTGRTYPASNAFGAHAIIHETDVESYRINITNLGDFPGSEKFLLSTIRSGPDDARRIKTVLSSLAVCSISRGEEISAEDAILDKATITEPQEYYELIHVLKMKLLAIWFFDSSTGKIYAKVEPNEIVKPSPPELPSHVEPSAPESPSPRPTPVTVQEQPALLTPVLPKTVVPQSIRVGGNEAEANLIRRIRPNYPPLAKQARIQGTVRFNVVIAKDGTPQNVQVVSGHPMLVQAALEAVKQWLYKPTEINGEPVEVITTIDVSFTLNQ